MCEISISISQMAAQERLPVDRKRAPAVEKVVTPGLGLADGRL
jgi:hypothetical protein